LKGGGWVGGLGVVGGLNDTMGNEEKSPLLAEKKSRSEWVKKLDAKKMRGGFWKD